MDTTVINHNNIVDDVLSHFNVSAEEYHALDEKYNPCSDGYLSSDEDNKTYLAIYGAMKCSACKKYNIPHRMRNIFFYTKMPNDPQPESLGYSLVIN